MPGSFDLFVKVVKVFHFEIIGVEFKKFFPEGIFGNGGFADDGCFFDRVDEV